MRIGSVVLLLDGYCYQSYNWSLLRPLGQLQDVISYLDKYETDEIAILRPVRDTDTSGSFQKDIEVMKKLKSLTPISFGGGLRTLENINQLHQLPIERVILTSSFLKNNIDVIDYVRCYYGHQSIQCLLPLSLRNGNICVFLPSENTFININDLNLEFINAYANEIILYDIDNEGNHNGFNIEYLRNSFFSKSKVIVSGGISLNSIRDLKKYDIASILIDNKTLHNEYSIKGYKDA